MSDQPPPGESGPPDPFAAPGPGPGGYGQPAYAGPGGYGPPGGQPPPNHLVWAILSTLFCCLPAGIVSIVFAAQVSSKYAAGDVQGALESSRKARTWAIVSTGIGVGLLVVWLLAIVALAVNSNP